jgi:hypothetical protein
MTGLWGWGWADAGEWQTLYRVEGARRALAQSRAAYFNELERARAERRQSLATVQFAWSRGSMGRAAAARREQRDVLRRVTRRARQRILDAEWRSRRVAYRARQAKGASRMAELADEIAAAGGRNGWVYEQRQLGRTYRAIADDVGLLSERVRQICKKEERRRRRWEPECEREEYERRIAKAFAAWEKTLVPGRPIDIDAAERTQRRDVWLTYLPPPDPRLDNMVPV